MRTILSSLPSSYQASSTLWQRTLCSSSQSAAAGEAGCSTRSSTDEGVKRVLREAHAAEAAACGFFAGQHLVQRGRADVAYLLEQEQEARAKLARELPAQRVRPSLLQGVLGGAGLVLGVAAGALPRSLNLHILGAVQELAQEVYNDQLRELREQAQEDKQQGRAAAVGADHVRELVRELRDIERAPDGAPPVPDIVTVQRDGVQSVGMGGAAALAVKLIGRAAVSAAAKL